MKIVRDLVIFPLLISVSQFSCLPAPKKPTFGPTSGGIGPVVDPTEDPLKDDKDQIPTEKPRTLVSTAPYTYKRLWRLTPIQLSKSVASILKKNVDFEAKFDVGSQPEEGFGTEAGKLEMDKVISGKLEGIFGKLLAESVKEVQAFAPCKIEDTIPDTCVTGFVEQFGESAFRRPLDAEERSRYKKVYTSVRKIYPTQEALSSVAEAILRSPYTVFRFELGDEASTEAASPLTEHELAAALSYAATDRPPDKELLTAATSGKLKTDVEISEQVERLVNSDNFIPVYTEFLARYTGVTWIYKKEKNKDSYFIYDTEMVKAVDKEFRDYVHDNVKDKKAEYKLLMTNPSTRMESRIAKIYGTAESEGFRPFVYVSDPNRRSGLWTLPGVLAANSPAVESGTIHRGNTLKRRLLCEGTSPPPKGLDVKLSDSPESLKLPMRKRLVQHSQDPNCAPCHVKMDSLGFSMDNYNAIGGFVEKDKGEPIDASGSVMIGDKKLDYSHGVDFIKKAIEVPDVQKCFVKNVFRYVFGRNENSYDRETIEAALKNFQDKNYDVREIFKQFLKSEAYRLRNSPIYKD